jgi:hypothetical protein
MDYALDVIGSEKVICFAITNLSKGEGKADGLAICQSKIGGFYLFSCNADWKVLADTWHESIDDAIDQAEYEYKGITELWQYKYFNS